MREHKVNGLVLQHGETGAGQPQPEAGWIWMGLEGTAFAGSHSSFPHCFPKVNLTLLYTISMKAGGC